MLGHLVTYRLWKLSYLIGLGLVNSKISYMIALKSDRSAAMTITSEAEWAERAAAFLKHKLREAEVTYVELAKRLKKHGLKEKPRPRLRTS